MTDTERTDADTYERWSQESWDQRYSESEKVWSGNPNQRLVEQVADLSPGTALDVGAGEGGDAIWLASRGWRVTALDVSEVALAKVAAHAAEAGVGDHVTTLHHDLIAGGELPDGFDLVSAQFLHPPLDKFEEIHRRLAAAVRPGGHLLVVGHHPMDVETGVRSGHGHSELLFTPDKVLAALPTDGWEVLVADTPTRESHHGHGPAEVTDSVVLARRL